ncbi:MAG: DNA repair protein RecO [Bacillota bacterium]
MKLYKTEAIVLRTINLREADLLVVLFSREYGKLRVMAHGARKPASRKRGFVQPFCYSRFLLHKGREMDSISQCEGVELFPDLLQSLRTIGYASRLTGLVENLTAEGEANEKVFLLLLQALRLLARGDAEILARAFEVKLVSFLGYRPVLQHCAACRRPPAGAQAAFSAAAGGVLCSACARGGAQTVIWCRRGTVETLKLFLRWELARLENCKVGAQARRELKAILENYIEYHLGYRGTAAEFWRHPGGPGNDHA